MGEKLSLPDNIIKNTIKEDLLKKYNDNTLIRGLIQAVPYGAVVDNVLTVAYNNILIERSNVFFDELSLGNVELSPELINTEDFLHSFFSTYKAALYTKQREKIRFLSRLLKNGLTTDLLSKADEFDDYLKILDELTFREITILYILNNYESSCKQQENDENNLTRANTFWSDFDKEATVILNITSPELNSFLTRAERTGCYSAIIGSFWGYAGNRGFTTETFKKLKELIELKKDDLVYYHKGRI